MDPAGAQVSAQAGIDWKLALTVITALTALSATVLGPVVAVKNNNKNIASQIERERWETFRKLCSQLFAEIFTTLVETRPSKKIGKPDMVFNKFINITSLRTEILLMLCNDNCCHECKVLDGILEDIKTKFSTYFNESILKNEKQESEIQDKYLKDLVAAIKPFNNAAKAVLHKHLYEEFRHKTIWMPRKIWIWFTHKICG